MSYLERIIIGVVLLISAYNLYTGAEERHHFHLAINQLSQLAGRCLGCFRCIEAYRQAAVILIFTAGATLVMDAGITLPIIAQILLTGLEVSELKGHWNVAQLQSVLVSFALLVFLFRNIGDFRQASVPAAPVHAPAAPAAEASAAPSPPKNELKEKLAAAEPKVEDSQKGGKKKNK